MKGGIEEPKKIDCWILLSLNYLNHKLQGGLSMKQIGNLVIMAVVLVLFTAHVGFAAYNHLGDTDSVNFRTAYPDKVGTKLDSCTLCHTGGNYTPPGGKESTLGSCQYCHAVTNYGADLSEATLLKTLNSYGLAYKNNGRDAGALQRISGLDSDGDGYSNAVEIAAIRYPGDSKDDPSKAPAPYRVFTREQLEQMPQHTQFLLMNASKSDDSYTQYSGVALENLIEAIMLDSATGITVYSPDGFATYHPFSPSTNPNSYHVFGIYPQGTFYYDERADIAIHPPDPPNYVNGGWCNYSSPSAAGRTNGSAIFNPEGLKMMLAFKRDGEYLTPGVLNSQNKLDGEGPFRVVPPQKNPGPPDQRSSSKNQGVIWPYDSYADHNAGFSSRSVTIIKVEPLPEGTTDIDLLEAGWSYIDANKIVVYGAIDPVPTILEKLKGLISAIKETPDSAFRNRLMDDLLIIEIMFVEWEVYFGAHSAALHNLQTGILTKTDGCISGSKADRNDWVIDCEVQKQLYWAINEIVVLLNIII
jgi:hypothetical protein